MLHLLLRNWQLVAIGLLVATLAGTKLYIGSLNKDISVLESGNKTLQAELGVSQEAVKNLQGAINEQNEAIQKLKSAADERAKANQAELKRAQATAGAFRQQAADILKNVAPQGVPKCDAANQLINEEIRNAK